MSPRRALTICPRHGTKHAAGTRCPTCVQRRRRGTTAQRGYGSQHQRLRAQLRRLVDDGDAVCWRCGKPIAAGSPFDLGHDDQDRSLYRGPEHPECNRGRRGSGGESPTSTQDDEG